MPFYYPEVHKLHVNIGPLNPRLLTAAIFKVSGIGGK